MSLASRKFLVTVAGVVLTALLQYLDSLSTPAAAAISALVSAYLAANVAQKAVASAAPAAV